MQIRGVITTVRLFYFPIL